MRLTRIATRTGDDGSTGLGDGSRVRKDDLRVVAMGDVDELNSHLGHLAADGLPPAVARLIGMIQHDLFDLGAELCIPGFEKLADGQLEALDQALLQLNAELTPLAEFILPGGTASASRAHLARTVCRRAERNVVALTTTASIRPRCQQYLNRLSDLLFLIARTLNREAGVPDVLWRNKAL